MLDQALLKLNLCLSGEYSSDDVDTDSSEFGMPLCFGVPCDTFIFFVCLSLFKTLGDLLLIQLPQCFLAFARMHYLHIKVCSFFISSWRVVIIVQSFSCYSVTSYLQLQCNRMKVCKCLCKWLDSKSFRLCGPYSVCHTVIHHSVRAARGVCILRLCLWRLKFEFHVIFS